MLRRVPGPSTLSSSSSSGARRNVQVTTCKRDDMTAVASNHTSTSLRVSNFHDRLHHVSHFTGHRFNWHCSTISPRRRHHRSLKHKPSVSMEKIRPIHRTIIDDHRSNELSNPHFSHPSTKFHEMKHRSAGHWNFSTLRLGMLGPNESAPKFRKERVHVPARVTSSSWKNSKGGGVDVVFTSEWW